MDCENCGGCCLGQSIPVSAMIDDRITTEFVDANGCLKQTAGRCVFFDTETRLCTNYPNRPRVCVRFLPGSARCLYTRFWAEVQLDWFNPDSSAPSAEEILKAFEPVMNAEDMTIVSIPDTSEQVAAPAIQRYNDAVRHCTHF